MLRVIIVVLGFLCSMSLITLAYSQENLEEAAEEQTTNSPTGSCEVGSQLPPTVEVGTPDPTQTPKEQCGSYSAYIQGACCCAQASGDLGCRNNPVCIEALGQSKIFN